MGSKTIPFTKKVIINQISVKIREEIIITIVNHLAGDVSMEKIRQKILEFRDQRDWKKYHHEKDLAISISLEANELLENFQWRSSEDAVADSKQNIKEEMADILIYLVQMADKMDVDLEEEVYSKLEKNAKKYPVKVGEQQ